VVQTTPFAMEGLVTLFSTVPHVCTAILDQDGDEECIPSIPNGRSATALLHCISYCAACCSIKSLHSFRIHDAAATSKITA